MEIKIKKEFEHNPNDKTKKLIKAPLLIYIGIVIVFTLIILLFSNKDSNIKTMKSHINNVETKPIDFYTKGEFIENDDGSDFFKCELKPFTTKFSYIASIDVFNNTSSNPTKEETTVSYKNNIIKYESSRGNLTIKTNDDFKYITNSQIGNIIFFTGKYSNGKNCSISINDKLLIMRHTAWVGNFDEVAFGYYFMKIPVSFNYNENQ